MCVEVATHIISQYLETQISCESPTISVINTCTIYTHVQFVLTNQHCKAIIRHGLLLLSENDYFHP